MQLPFLKNSGKTFSIILHNTVTILKELQCSLKSLSLIPYILLNIRSLDRRILEELNCRKKLTDISGFEKKILANFLSSKHKTGFMRRDLEEYYKEHSSIRHTSEAHIRGKINKLVILKILNKTGEGKSTRYNLTNSFLKQVKNDVLFSLPDISMTGLTEEMKLMNWAGQLLSTQRSIYSGSDRVW